MRTKIDPAFSPKLSPAEMRDKFPLLDPVTTKEAFVAYHLEKDDTSHNWDATFYGWCDWRQRQAAEARRGDRDTDSMGFPLGPGKTIMVGGEGDYGRRFLEAFIKHKEAGLSFEEAQAAATRDVEGETP